MKQIPALKPEEVINILNHLDFTEVKQRGSHKQLAHADGRITTVPVHYKFAISPALLRRIARDIELDLVDVLKHR